MTMWEKWFFGDERFRADEQKQRRVYRALLLWLAWAATASAAAAVAWRLGWRGSDGAVPAGHQNVVHMYAIFNVLLWMGLRGRRHLWRPVAWAHLSASLLALLAIALD